MATPTYNGSAQPTTNSGWLGGLGSWFSVKAPAYAGAKQPVAASSGYFGGSTPAYKTAPASTSGDNDTSDSELERITLLVPRSLARCEPVDPQQ